MLITKKVKIKANSRLIEHYESKGYIFKYLEEFNVKVIDLSIGSHVIITMSCDICKNKKDVRYASLNDKINYEWICKSCIRKQQLSSGAVKNNFKDKILQKELANRNIEGRIKKSKETKKEKYGNENYSNLNKRSETMLIKYNNGQFNNPKKIKQTLLDRYGFYFNNQEKMKKTCIERYSVDHPSKVPEIFEKMQKSRFEIKYYKDYNLFYQGSYERKFLELCEKLNIINNVKRGLTIDYFYINQNRKYYSDFYIEDWNLIIEIKSSYTYNMSLEKNLAKQKKCIELGYNFLFIINNNFDGFYNLIK